MDHSWVLERNRVSPHYIAGIRNFMELAQNHMQINSMSTTRCPCRRCENNAWHDIETIHAHLLSKGFSRAYTKWVHHGETRENEPTSTRTINDSIEENDEMFGALEDVFGQGYVHVGGRDNGADDSMNDQQQNFDELYEAMQTELYSGCSKFSGLTFLVKLMHLKVLNSWSDKSFDMLLKLLKDALPSDSIIPNSYYDAKKKLHALGLGYESIDVCKYDCILFWKENAHLVECPVCHTSRYQHDSISEGKGKKAPHKVVRYFPITPRLQRLYRSRHTAKDMRWHKEKRLQTDGVLRHPADGDAWKYFDDIYPSFASDCRNVRLGLASNGFNPYGNMSTSYSMWPVILVPYNLPPWMCMKESNMMLSLLIPGPKSPGKDFDVFLRPLLEELKDLWKNGIGTYDAHSKSNFTMRAAVLWTISDFPAYAYLSGWSTKGYMACPECLQDTKSMKLIDRIGYVGHRCWLPQDHPWRKSKEFNGSVEYDDQPREFNGDDILQQLKNVPMLKPGKSPQNEDKKRKRSEREFNWTKRSIFFELEYWSKLKLRHNLDVMHIEKNVCDNVIGTLLNIKGKSKDNKKARQDLENLGTKRELWVKKRDGKSVMPQAAYAMTKDERNQFLEFLKSVKLPDGFASNIGRCVTEDGKLIGLKTHDCHVLFQYLLPTGILPFFNKQVRSTVTEFSHFFQQLCSYTLHVNELDELKKGIVLVLCKLERIFPPSFFSIMVHLCVHLVDQAKLGGPVRDRWMYVVERCLGSYKKYVRNKARPEGSIAEAYVVHEALTHCSKYLKDVETKINRPERNYDMGSINTDHEMSIFNMTCRCFGSKAQKELESDLREEAHWYVINNSPEVQPYLDEHMEILKKDYSQDLDKLQEKIFPAWFKARMENLRFQKSPEATDDLYSLAEFPEKFYTSWSSCMVNGVRFHCKRRDDTLRTQNSGICVLGSHEGEEIDFYGVILEVVQLSYILRRKVVLFKCKWFKSIKNKKHTMVENNLTSININSDWYSDQPFIFATQAQQVFYLDDKKHGKNWKVVQKVKHRHLWNILEEKEDFDPSQDVDVDDDEEEDASHLQFRPEESNLEVEPLVRNDVEPIEIEDVEGEKLDIEDVEEQEFESDVDVESACSMDDESEHEEEIYSSSGDDC